jgi:hypothetical protein
MQRREVLAGVAVLGIGVGGYTLIDGRSPTETVRSFLNAIAAGNESKARQFTHEDMSGGVQSNQSFQLDVLDLTELSAPTAHERYISSVTDTTTEEYVSQVKSVVKETEASGRTHVMADYTVSTTDGTESSEETTCFFLVQTDGWLIYNAY